MTLASAFLSLFVGLLVIPPVIYYGVRRLMSAGE